MIDALTIEELVAMWVREFVVSKRLCPFAKHVVTEDAVRYKVSLANSLPDLMADLQLELRLLQLNQDLATSLLIIPKILDDFSNYLNFYDSAQLLLAELELEGIFQLASFHPHYQFEHTRPEAPENLSNRSPFPVIHILRESQVELAIKTFGDPSDIPRQNILLLQGLSEEEIALHVQKYSLD